MLSAVRTVCNTHDVVKIPAPLRAKADELGLGDCVRRYRRRPGLIGTACAALPLVGAAVGATVGHDPIRALGIVLFLWPPIFLSWYYVTRKRLDGGVFLFIGGFAEVYGRKVREVVTWDEAIGVRYRRHLTLLNFVPWFYDAACEIDVRGRRSAVLFDSTYLGLHRIAEYISSRGSNP